MPTPHDPLPADTPEPLRPLLAAYAHGAFPMADPDEPDAPIRWYDPDPRGVIPLADDGLRVSRSLRQTVRAGRFLITHNRDFPAVIRACAAPRHDDAPITGVPITDTWIDDRIVAAYEALHHAGHAWSIEAWLRPSFPPSESGMDGEPPPTPTLVGGLYGVALRGLFAGESMFSRPHLGGTDASKVCLVHLWTHLRRAGFALLDTQFSTPHLARLGCVEIRRADYHTQLAQAMRATPTNLPFDPDHAPTVI